MPTPPDGFERRHVVSIEDHLYHTAEMLEAVERVSPDLLPCLTCCAIDQPGSDTTAIVSGWLERYGSLQVAACVEPSDISADLGARLIPIEVRHLSELSSFTRLVASLLQPGGILLQDVHLSTLRFIQPDRWWESIYVAATVRGTFARKPPAVRFLSNKRGYTATFGRDLMDAGFDPREVMDKAELETVIVPSITRELRARFPYHLRTPDRDRPTPVGSDADARQDLDSQIDVMLWDIGGRLELSGRAVTAPVAFRAASNEATTWQELILDRIQRGPGLAVTAVGERLADRGAERAEMSNLAARHVHALRARLTNSQALQTQNHAYRLDPALKVGIVSDRHLR